MGAWESDHAHAPTLPYGEAWSNRGERVEPSMSATKRGLWAAAVALLPVIAVAMGEGPLRLDYRTERPGGSCDDPIVAPRDLSGRSIKTPRVRILHSTDATQAGTS